MTGQARKAEEWNAHYDDARMAGADPDEAVRIADRAALPVINVSGTSIVSRPSGEGLADGSYFHDESTHTLYTICDGVWTPC